MIADWWKNVGEIGRDVGIATKRYGDATVLREKMKGYRERCVVIGKEMAESMKKIVELERELNTLHAEVRETKEEPSWDSLTRFLKAFLEYKEGYETAFKIWRINGCVEGIVDVINGWSFEDGEEGDLLGGLADL